MSSDIQSLKKRKPYTTLACEVCRKRKVRCENDGDGSICERCKISGTECRYENIKSRGKRKRKQSQTSRGTNTDTSIDQPPAMTTTHPLLRHKKRKTCKEGEEECVSIHLSNNIEVWSEDQKYRILNSECKRSKLRTIQNKLESNNRDIQNCYKEIDSRRQQIDEKNVENEKLITLYHKLEKNDSD